MRKVPQKVIEAHKLHLALREMIKKLKAEEDLRKLHAEEKSSAASL